MSIIGRLGHDLAEFARNLHGRLDELHADTLEDMVAASVQPQRFSLMVMALFAGLADVMPFVGGFLATAPAVVAALPAGMPAAVIVFVGLCGYQEFENRIGKALCPMRLLRQLRSWFR